MNSSHAYICLLDTPSLLESNEQKRLHLRYRKALGLLGFLAAECNRNHSRAFLATLFWPDFDEPTARLNLRQSLSALTKLFNNTQYRSALVVNREFIALQQHPQLRFDIQDLEHPENLESVMHNEGLLTGVFMAGYSLTDCDEFESWLEDKRSYYRSCQVRLLTQLLSQAQTKHKSDQVINLTTKLLKIDPDNESLLCEAMRLCSDYGQPQLSLKLYEHFSQRMERDLGVSPNTTSQALYKQILQLSQAAVSIPSHANQFPAVEKISPVIVVHLQWRCHLKDPEAIAQSLYDADHYARKVLCSEIHAYHLSSAGRGAFFYFGWPKALDDNAWIAIRGVLRLMHYANTHADLELRAGIHSGLLLSSIKASIPDLLGDITEETSLLCQSANNGQALMSESCYHLVRNKVKAHKLIEHRRRIDGNIQASYLLLDVQDWLNDDNTFYYPELKKYHQSLDTHFERAIQSQSTVLTYTQAAAGTGKSTQVNSWLANDNAHYLLKFFCYPDRQHYALFPIIGCLRQLLDLQPDQLVSSHAIEERFSASGWKTDKELSILIDMLASNSPPSRQKIELILDELFILLQHLNDGPLVIWIEDGHWIDEATFYFLELLPSKTNKAILVIMTARQLPYSGQFTHWHSIPLQKPCLVSAAQMIRHFNKDLPNHLPLDRIEHMLTLSDHNPFLLRSLVFSKEDHLPLSIQHHYSFSIDQMGSLRDQALQHAIHRTSHKHDKLKSISPLLAQTLVSLTPPTHLSHIHRTIAEDSVKKRKVKTDDCAKQAELAEHWLQCNEKEKAAKLFLDCANRALASHSYRKGAHYFGQLIKINQSLNQLDDNHLLPYLIHYANCRIQAFGYSDKYAVDAASEALKLCQSKNAHQYLFQCVILTFVTLDENNKASVKLQCANFLLQLANTDEKQCIAHWALSHAHFLNQDYRLCRDHADQSLRFFKKTPEINTLVFFNENITINCLILIGLSHYFDNNRRLAMDCIDQMLNREKRNMDVSNLSDYDRCRLYFFSSYIAFQCGFIEKSTILIKRCIKLADDLKHAMWFSAARILELHTDKQPDQILDIHELKWILDNIKTSYKESYPIFRLLALALLTKESIHTDMDRLFKSNFASSGITTKPLKHSLLDDFLKQN